MFAARQFYHRTVVFALCCIVALIVVFNLGMRFGTNKINVPFDINHQVDQIRNDFNMTAVTTTSLELTGEKRFSLQYKHSRPRPPVAEPFAYAASVSVKDDVHMQMTDRGLSTTRRRTTYPPRLNMGSCPKLFGKIIVFVTVVEMSFKTHYHVALESLRCYLKSVDYEFKLVDLDHDERVNRLCKHEQLFFKKHCAASVYLNDTDWMLILDADTGVVNPNHCIEEWIDDRVDLVFYERFFNWEIASGNYLAKNTEFARNFLRKWADWEYIQPKNWNGADNGVLQIHILQTVLPYAKEEIRSCDAIWHRGSSYETYMAYVTCVKVTLGAQRLYPGQLRVLRRGHGFVRDGYMTGDAWSERDFFLHGWKLQEIGLEGWTSPFSRMFNVSQCESNSYAGWNWRADKRLSVEEIRQQLANFEHTTAKSYPKEARIHPYLLEPDIAACYPHCDDAT